MGLVDKTSSNLLERAFRYWDRKWENTAVERSLYLECRRNLALLSALNFDLSGEEERHDLLKAAAHLESDILEQIFFDGVKFNILLNRRVEIKFEDEDESEDYQDVKTVGNLLVVLYGRITSLQKISSIGLANKAIRKIRIGQRLRNIRSALLEVVGQIDRQ